MAFADDGFALLPGIDPSECAAILERLQDMPRDGSRGGLRHVLNVPQVAELIQHPAIRNPIETILGSKAFAFKATYFEKSPESNWFVGWHQDIVIPVAEQIDAPGFSHWTEKSGVLHTQPPREVLEAIVAVRVNLDASTPENGALEVLPQTHHSGILQAEQFADFIREIRPVQCLTPVGGLVLMRPLLLHASSRMIQPTSRRVLHFEFAARDLPYGLQWQRRIPLLRDGS